MIDCVDLACVMDSCVDDILCTSIGVLVIAVHMRNPVVSHCDVQRAV